LLLALLPVLADGTAVETQPADAATILQIVRSRFPSDPVRISGTITVRRRRGVVVKEMGYQLDAKWSEQGADLTCVITDALGRESDKVAVTFAGGEDPTVKREGDGLVDDKGRITQTALSCADLAMPFLWWPDAELIGREKTRGRDSFILDLKPGGDGEVHRVRAWIDSAIFIVLKAESYDADDELVKQVTVKSFKKVEDQWMIKDLEVSMGSAADKTVVTVDSIESKAERREKKNG
jgi:hypothetical protein